MKIELSDDLEERINFLIQNCLVEYNSLQEFAENMLLHRVSEIEAEHKIHSTYTLNGYTNDK